MSELTVDLAPAPGFIHVVLAVWVPDQGWMTSIPGAGHPMEGPIEDTVAFKAKLAAKAIIRHFESPQLAAAPRDHRGGVCSACGGMTQPTGSCETCTVCGTSGGCS
jgi:hypothetical protein